ncbi:hypothetical protein CDG76_01850 [Nostoc sp. 'Peltigera membranacea cyanobiont' 210A]|nr:hypothetical protein CDG76_01850 [Nostoc sp. 'Peltigera membranacea cyanobiont' 210A]
MVAMPTAVNYAATTSPLQDVTRNLLPPSINVSSMNLSLPASLSETEREEQRKIQLFALLSDTERGWGRGQIRLVELT